MNDLFAVDSTVVAATLLLLVLLSVATWSISLLKLRRQMRNDKANSAFSEAFWAARDWHSAAEVAQQGTSDLARLAQAGFDEVKNLSAEQRQDLQHMGAPQDVLERMLRQQVENIQRNHERGLAELATIGSTSPFVGLFGTVWGILHALQDIGLSGTASLDVVAGPIGEALIATAIGIATALPAVLAYNYFLRRLRVQVTELENFAHDFVRLALKHNFKL
ncbi:MotA/TolQ/ExbB proton channel family protein [Candidatus Nitrotoga sp. M5]|uniref:MotA/TolQ/ExbB proton channel family protein n=1 Tax=Candidatus Nitrotoga sp. M5 TaxID=2890409 RepID=UPI001EF431A8|nr:MotA/TolQ/ExbB proton channel family protein [Candidatus Nitrotoga sp. M5]CAH1387300.1 MotA/TolQ/ExbB proton channel family protein [Candidatus Nitrotoga sp. M5]